MSDPTPTKKVLKTQFLIRKADDAAPAPVTPVKIAPPPAVKRSKSLKTDRTKFKRYQSAPGGINNNNNTSHTLPRHFNTKPDKQKPEQETDKPVSVENGKAENGKRRTEKTEEEIVEGEEETLHKAELEEGGAGADNGVEEREEEDKKELADMPTPATWQTVVNTHRRGSSMTFVSTQNWAQFDKIVGKESEKESQEFDWNIKTDTWAEYEEQFHEIKPLHGFISGKQAKEFLSKTNIPTVELVNIWNLADMDHDGSLSLVEFAVALQCVGAVEHGEELPAAVPGVLRDSLLYHVNNRNNMLSSLKANENSRKSPEKSSLKNCASTPKNTTVTFKEDASSCCDTLPRSRPRPTKKLVSSTPLHLRPQCIHSSSSYYSSDNSDTSDNDSVVKTLDMSDHEQDAKKDKKKEHKKHKAKKSHSKSHSKENRDSSDAFSSMHETSDAPETAAPEAPPKTRLRAERTYDDIDDFRKKIDVDEDDEDALALIESSDEDDVAHLPSLPPPSAPAPRRAPSIPMGLGAPRRPPAGPPPSSSPSSPPTSPTSPTSLPPSSPPPSNPPPSNPPPCTPPPCAAPDTSPTDLTTSDGGNTSSSYKETSDHHDPSGYERLADDSQQAPVTILLDGGEVISSDESQGSERDAIGDLAPTEDASLLAAGKKRIRGLSLDTQMLTQDDDCVDGVPSSSILPSSCPIASFRLTGNVNDLVADAEELKSEIRPEHDRLNLDLNEAEKTDIDIDRLKEKDLDELRTLIRDYELHNKALLNITRELKIELIKVKEHKFHLLSTLDCMKKV